MDDAVRSLLERFPSERTWLLPALQAVQEIEGWLSPEALTAVAEHVRVLPSEASAIATDYDNALRLIKPGSHLIRICTGRSCRLTGATEHLRVLEDHLGIACGRTTSDGRITLEEADCLSVCSLAPVLEVDGACHGRVASAAVERFPMWFRTRRPWHVDVDVSDFPEVHAEGQTARERLEDLRAQAEARVRRRPEFRFLVQGGTCGEALGAGELVRALRLMAAMRGLAAEVLDGGCHGMCSAGLVVEVQHAGWPPLTFTHLTKDDVPDLLAEVAGGESPLMRFEWEAWERVLAAPRYFVVNGEAGAPGLLTDCHLMEGDPQRVLEGLLIAAYAAETSRGIIYVNGTARFAFDRMARALAKAQAAHLIGDGILGSAFSFHVEIRRGPRVFVRGDERALPTSIEGQRASPGTKPQLPPESRLWGKPTVISNVETLAAIPPVIAWDSGGRASQSWSATRLFGVSGPVNRPGIVEVEGHVTLRELLFEVAAGLRDGRTLKGVLAAGPSGSMLPPESLDRSLEALATGTRGVIPIRDGD